MGKDFNIWEELNRVDSKDIDIDKINMNVYDDDYIEGVTDEFAESLYNLLQELVSNDDLCEDFTSGDNLTAHFKSHCIGGATVTPYKSKRGTIYYDFQNEDEYANYEKLVTDALKKSGDTVVIYTLYEVSKIDEAFESLLNDNKSLLFTHLCGFRNDVGAVLIGLHNTINNVTSNFGKEPTIDVVILTQGFRTITLYPIAKGRLERSFNKIIQKYNQDKNLVVKLKN